MRKLANLVKDIMFIDFDSNYLTIECCNIKINGVLLTHCYYDNENDKFHFTSGDMEKDKHAEEILLTDEQTKNVLREIIECY